MNRAGACWIQIRPESWPPHDKGEDSLKSHLLGFLGSRSITKGSGFATVTTAGQEQSQQGNDQDLLNDLHDYLAPTHWGQALLHPEKIPDHTNAFDDTCESGQSRSLQSGQGNKCTDWVNASKSIGRHSGTE